MKIENRFDRAVQALVTAYFDGTLAKGNCAACAVGNMVAAGYGRKVTRPMALDPLDTRFPDGFKNHLWFDFIHTQRSFFFAFARETGYQNIEATGYSNEQILMIETAFENNTKINFQKYHKHTQDQIMADQYNGLMAVVDVLCEIEGKEAKPVKELFNKRAVVVE